MVTEDARQMVEKALEEAGYELVYTAADGTKHFVQYSARVGPVVGQVVTVTVEDNQAHVEVEGISLSDLPSLLSQGTERTYTEDEIEALEWAKAQAEKIKATKRARVLDGLLHRLRGGDKG